MSARVFNQIRDGLIEARKTIAVPAAPKGKGGAPGSARPIQGNAMQTVAEAPIAGKQKAANVARFHTISGVRSASLWLTEQISKAAGTVTTQVVEITPDLATALLERNPANRKISENLVEQFARDIKEDNWTFNGESIIVSNDGFLNDGQHRCSAVVAAKTPIKAILVIGPERETRTTLDQGKNRLISDYLTMDGHVGAPILASAAYIAWQVEKYGFTTRSKDMRPTKAELMAFIASNGALERHVQRIPQYGVRKIGGQPVLAFCRWYFTKWANPADAENFIEALISGTNLERGDPILYVRNRLMDKSGLTVAERTELIFRGWNAHRRGERISRLPILGGKLPDLEA